MSRFTRLAVASGLALAASAPMTSSAGAFMCTPEFEIVCVVYAEACKHVPAGDKVDPHELVCETFA